MSQADIGVIGGSGFYSLPGFHGAKEVSLDTPWGAPSDAYMVGELQGRRIAFLARHGRGHCLLPSELNFQANIYGFKKLGVQRIVSFGACGSLNEDLPPGKFVLPDQFFDRSHGRSATFFGNGIVAHITFGDPVCPELLDPLEAACTASNVLVRRGGTYICMEGPAFSTKAESRVYRSWGMDVIGMTNLQEAKLAREAEICYATVAMVTDFDCWHPDHDSVTIQQVIEHLMHNSENAVKVLLDVLPRIPAERKCRCGSALENSIITARDRITPEARQRLGLLIDKYLSSEKS